MEDKDIVFDIENGTLMEYFGNDVDVVIPDEVTDIFFYVFSCTRINSVVIPGSVEEIAPYTFSQSELTTATLKEGVQQISCGAFEKCKRLEKVFLPKSLVCIERSAFLECGSLKEIHFNGTEEEWQAVKKEEGWNKDASDFCVVCK